MTRGRIQVRKPNIFVIFQGGPDPLSHPLDPHMVLRKHIYRRHYGWRERISVNAILISQNVFGYFQHFVSCTTWNTIQGKRVPLTQLNFHLQESTISKVDLL